MNDAADIILTPDGEHTTEERWERETPYLLDLMEQNGMVPAEDNLILDYGCGIGRLSLAMIKRWGCRVLGVDISPSMQMLAIQYVNDPRFLVCSPPMIDVLHAYGLRCDMGICVWCLQHVANPEAEVERIRKMLSFALAPRIHNPLFVVNEVKRFVPIKSKDAIWVDDGKSVLDILTKVSSPNMKLGDLDPKVVTQDVSDRTFWGMFR